MSLTQFASKIGGLCEGGPYGPSPIVRFQMRWSTKMEPFLALGIAAVWGIYGGIYFLRSSKASGRTTLVTSRT